ncbi:thiamine diphosphokinase [Alloscardovia theropitheci]|nr:thiamine diphosphokinase [Alloscardovia theropitheci]
MGKNSSESSISRSARRAIIFGAGQYFDEMPFIPADAYVIAADGGYDHVVSLGITPHAFIGDKDSLLEELPEDSATRIIELPSEKDDSDLMAAVRYAWSMGVREFEFFGVSGGRVDHSFANIQIAAKISSFGGAAFLHADHTIITVISNAIMTFPGGYVSSKRPISIFAYSSTCKHVSIEGLKYGVDDIEMNNLDPLGLSNEFLPDTPVTIAVDGGSLVIMYPSEAPTPRIIFHVDNRTDFGNITQEVSSRLYSEQSSGSKRGRHAVQ